jgi:hypothetical protein
MYPLALSSLFPQIFATFNFLKKKKNYAYSKSIKNKIKISFKKSIQKRN